MLAAHHPSLALLGISTVYGNAPLHNTTNNALSILEAIGRSEICVFPGASQPFCRAGSSAPNIHGESGLDGTELLPKPRRKPLSHCNAIKEMRDALLACRPNTAWLVATGALTNVALLMATFPGVARHIKGVSIMGGAIGGGFSNVYMGPPYTDPSGHLRPRIGNWTPYAEFNIWSDPEASQAIFRNEELKQKTLLVPLDVTHQACATKEIRDSLLYGRNARVHVENSQPTRLRRMFNELLMFFADTYESVFGLTEGPPLHDPLAVAVILAELTNGEDIGFDDRGGERWDINVVLHGEQTGRTRVIPVEKGAVIPRTIDLKKFWDTIEHCLDRADQAQLR